MTGQTWAETARLLRRTGFGVTGAAVDAAISTDVATLVATALAAVPAADPGALATPVPSFSPVPRVGKSASKSDRAAYNKQIGAQTAMVTQWWISRMLAVREPFGERLTFAWHSIFATGIQKVRSAMTMAHQNESLRSLGRGDFRELALTMLTDAAMLRWLDGETNTAKAPNENLARECMELFTLGHGDGYTETDVREGARALTGWRIDLATGTTSMNSAAHDNGLKTVLGVTGDLDQVGFCDAILARPASAPFVLGRLWNELVSDQAPTASTSGALVEAYGPTRNLTSALQAMFTLPGFAAAQGTKVVGPVEWAIGLARAVGIPATDATTVAAIGAAMRTLGQLPFEPPSVGGWPSGQAWLSTSAADARIRAATTIVAAGRTPSVADSSPANRLDAVAHLLGIATWSTRSRTALAGVTDPGMLTAMAANTPEYLSV